MFILAMIVVVVTLFYFSIDTGLSWQGKIITFLIFSSIICVISFAYASQSFMIDVITNAVIFSPIFLNKKARKYLKSFPKYSDLNSGA